MSDKPQEVKLEGNWTSEMLRALADVVKTIEHIPENQRQEALEKGMAMLERDRKFPSLKLVWNKE